MSTVDIYLLKVLSRNKELTHNEIVAKFRELELKKMPTPTAIYQRLRILSEREQVESTWNKGMKYYKICTKGSEEIWTIDKNLAIAC